MNHILNLRELESAAREALCTGPEGQMAWDYYASGADDEYGVKRNIEAFHEYELHYRVLAGVAHRDLRARVMGHELAMPILVAPSAFHRLAHDQGELASVRGTGDAGSLFVLSTLSTTAVEAVMEAATGPVWFQLYVYRDRAATEALVRRVEHAGCEALVLTADAPLLGRRERDIKNRFALPAHLSAQNMFAAGYETVSTRGAESGLAQYFADLLDPSLGWDAITWLRSITKLPVIVKGIVRPDDAVRAIEAGATGIIVSNHGGRQLDAAPATIDVLARVVEAVDGRAEVLLDGGIRRGSDVIKAIALGAKAVLVGRPVLWGLAAGGREGVAHALGLLRNELDLAMALCGCANLGAITRDLVQP